MARAVLHAADLSTIGYLEVYEELRWTRRFYGIGTVEFRVNRNVDDAQLLEPGTILHVADDLGVGPDYAYYLETVEVELDEDGRASEIVVARGVEYGLLGQRICLPPPHELPLDAMDAYHEVNGPAEDFMLDIVDKNVGAAAPAERQVPNLVVAASGDRGPSQVWQARFQTVLERLVEVGMLAELGFEVAFDHSDQEFEFAVLAGVDRTTTVSVAIELDSATAMRWARDLSEQATFAWVAGQGEGVSRDVDVAYMAVGEPTGLTRREVFVDARDVADETLLPSRGEEKLAELQGEQTLSADMSAFGPFRYRRDWDLGDTLRLRNDEWGVMRDARVVSIESRHRPEPGVRETVATFDEESPTLRGEIKRLGRAEAADRS